MVSVVCGHVPVFGVCYVYVCGVVICVWCLVCSMGMCVVRYIRVFGVCYGVCVWCSDVYGMCVLFVVCLCVWSCTCLWGVWGCCDLGVVSGEFSGYVCGHVPDFRMCCGVCACCGVVMCAVYLWCLWCVCAHVHVFGVCLRCACV